MSSSSISEPMSDNDALREILGECRNIEALLKGRYDDITETTEAAVTDSSPLTRAARADAVKTVVVNTGAQDILVYEGGVLAERVASHKNWVSPLNGGGLIEVYAVTGQTSSASIATYVKED